MNISELREIGLRLSAVTSRKPDVARRPEPSQADRKERVRIRRQKNDASRWQRIKADPEWHARIREAKRKRYERSVTASGRTYVPQPNRGTAGKRPMRRNKARVARLA